jgi:phosphoglycolate phosphatase-like HAD superfamily hydrolase
MSLIVFDLDGTLVDSRRDLAESTNEMLATYGAPPFPIDVVARMVARARRSSWSARWRRPGSILNRRRCSDFVTSTIAAC